MIKAEAKGVLRAIREIWRAPLFWALLFFLIGLSLALTHEPTSAEALPWQIAKNLTLENFFGALAASETPLWVLLLILPAKLGLPFLSGEILALFLITAAVWWLAKKSPWPILFNILLLFSWPLLGPALFFGLAPILLGIIAVADAFPRRLERPLKFCLALTLLAWSHYFLFLIALILALFFGLELILYSLYSTQKSAHSAQKSAKNPAAPQAIKSSGSVFVGSLFFIGASLILIQILVRFLMQNSVLAETLSAGGSYNFFTFCDGINEVAFGVTFCFAQILLIFMALYFLLFHIGCFVFYLITMTAFFATYLLLFNTYPSTLTVELFFALQLFSLQIAGNQAILTKSIPKPAKNPLRQLAEKSILLRLFTKHFPAYSFCFLLIFATIPSTLATLTKDWSEAYSNSAEIVAWLAENTPENAIVLIDGQLDESRANAVAALSTRKIYSVYNRADFTFGSTDFTGAVDDADFLALVAELSQAHPVYYLRYVNACKLNGTNYAPNWESTIFTGGFASEYTAIIYTIPEDLS